MCAVEQRSWAKAIIQKFMDGAKVASVDLTDACTSLDLKVEEVRRLRRRIGSMGRGRHPGVILTPCGGKVAA